MSRETIADIAAEIMVKQHHESLTVGDNAIMDRIAYTCDQRLGTKLMRHKPGTRPEHNQTVIIDALARTKRGQELFEQKWTRGGGRRGRVLARLMILRSRGRSRKGRASDEKKP